MVKKVDLDQEDVKNLLVEITVLDKVIKLRKINENYTRLIIQM